MRTLQSVSLIMTFIALTLGVIFAPAAQSSTSPRSSETQEQVEVINKNSEAWFARYLLINNATKTLNIQYYILENDIFGQAFLGLLHRKLKQGVKVRLMVDTRGSSSFIDLDGGYLKDLVADGADVRVYNPYLEKGISKELGSSCHQKLLIVDDRYFLTGGRNISADYLADPENDPTSYDDTDIVVNSPETASAATVAFYTEWSGPFVEILKPRALPLFSSDETTSRALAAMEERMLSPQLSVQTAHDYPKLNQYTTLAQFQKYRLFGQNLKAHITFEENTSDLHAKYHLPVVKNINAKIVELLEKAKSSVSIMNAYIVLTDEMKAALIGAAKRGVKIDFITNSPMSVDQIFTQVLFDKEWPGMLQELPGARIFASKLSRVLHSKVFCFDDSVCAIGSYNLDFQSGVMNAEDMLFVESRELNTEVRQVIDDYATNNSVEYTLDGNKGSNQLRDEGARLEIDALYPLEKHFRDTM